MARYSAERKKMSRYQDYQAEICHQATHPVRCHFCGRPLPDGEEGAYGVASRGYVIEAGEDISAPSEKSIDGAHLKCVPKKGWTAWGPFDF